MARSGSSSPLALEKKRKMNSWPLPKFIAETKDKTKKLKIDVSAGMKVTSLNASAFVTSVHGKFEMFGSKRIASAGSENNKE